MTTHAAWNPEIAATREVQGLWENRSADQPWHGFHGRAKTKNEWWKVEKVKSCLSGREPGDAKG